MTDMRRTPFKIQYGKTTFYFDSAECMEAFASNPKKYAK